MVLFALVLGDEGIVRCLCRYRLGDDVFVVVLGDVFQDDIGESWDGALGGHLYRAISWRVSLDVDAVVWGLYGFSLWGGLRGMSSFCFGGCVLGDIFGDVFRELSLRGGLGCLWVCFGGIAL